MDYIGLLTKIVKDSGLTHAEITDKCETDGVSFHYNYISAMKHDLKIPSDEVSRAIAKACGKHENLLVTQACYDRSPKAFKDMLDSIVTLAKSVVLMISMQKVGITDTEAIRIMRQKLDEMAVGEWLELDLSDMSRTLEQSFEALADLNGFGDLLNMLTEGSEAEDVCTYIMQDDSMSPKIPENAKVHTVLASPDKLKDGDFICYSKDGGETYIRQIEFFNDNDKKKMLLLPVNKERYKKEVIDVSTERLYEKAVQIVIDLE